MNSVFLTLILRQNLKWIVHDKVAANYTALATEDDGSCSYCPCDSEDYYYVLNKSKDCVGDPCIKVKRVNEQ